MLYMRSRVYVYTFMYIMLKYIYTHSLSLYWMIYINVHIGVRMCALVSVYELLHELGSPRVRLHTNACVCMYMYVCMCVSVCVYIYIHIHTYIHIYVHLHLCSSRYEHSVQLIFSSSWELSDILKDSFPHVYACIKCMHACIFSHK